MHENTDLIEVNSVIINEVGYLETDNEYLDANEVRKTHAEYMKDRYKSIIDLCQYALKITESIEWPN